MKAGIDVVQGCLVDIEGSYFRALGESICLFWRAAIYYTIRLNIKVVTFEHTVF